MENRWIPVSEKMPEERDSMFYKFKWTSKWKNDLLKLGGKVVAWMPFPEPYMEN